MRIDFELPGNGMKAVVGLNILALFAATVSLVWNFAVVTSTAERLARQVDEIQVEQVDQSNRITYLEAIQVSQEADITDLEEAVHDGSSTNNPGSNRGPSRFGLVDWWPWGPAGARATPVTDREGLPGDGEGARACEGGSPGSEVRVGASPRGDRASPGGR